MTFIMVENITPERNMSMSSSRAASGPREKTPGRRTIKGTRMATMENITHWISKMCIRDRDYTLGRIGVIVPEEMRIAQDNGQNWHWWGRSPCDSTISVLVVSPSGVNSTRHNTAIGVRPALWINLGSGN